jgi:hypothetical protein
MQALSLDARNSVAAIQGLVLAMKHAQKPEDQPAMLRRMNAHARKLDRLVGDLLDVLPTDAVLVITADHGQVQFEEWVDMEPVAAYSRAYAGDARLRYVYARPGAEGSLLKAATDAYGEVAWVIGRDQLVDEGWLGPEPPAGDVLSRLGDVTLAAKGTVAFADPTHPHETRLRAGHGSLSPDEMLVPLLAGRGRCP